MNIPKNPNRSFRGLQQGLKGLGETIARKMSGLRRKPNSPPQAKLKTTPSSEQYRTVKGEGDDAASRRKQTGSLSSIIEQLGVSDKVEASTSFTSSASSRTPAGEVQPSPKSSTASVADLTESHDSLQIRANQTADLFLQQLSEYKKRLQLYTEEISAPGKDKKNDEYARLNLHIGILEIEEKIDRVVAEYSNLSEQQSAHGVSAEDQHILGEEMGVKQEEMDALKREKEELEAIFKKEFNPDPILTPEEKTKKKEKEKKFEALSVCLEDVNACIAKKAAEIEKLEEEKKRITQGLIRSDSEDAYAYFSGGAYSELANVDVHALDAKIVEVDEQINIIDKEINSMDKQIVDNRELSLKDIKQEILNLSAEIAEFTKPKTDLSDLPKTLQESVALREEMLKKRSDQPSKK